MAVTINGTTGITYPDSSVENTAATGFGFKNRIINGAMMIDQRNAGASVTPLLGISNYTLDRWNLQNSQSSKLSVQQVVDSPAGFKYSLKVTVAAQYAPIATDYFGIAQPIEGLNVIDFAFGTSGAATITLSGQVKSSVTGTYSCRLTNNATNRSYIATYTISSANTWTPLVLTITGDITGTWATDNTIGVSLYFDLGSGANYNGTAGLWQAGNLTRTTGSISFVNQVAGSTWQIAAVQLEKGSTATAFDARPYGTELALCQRYYQRINSVGGAERFGAGVAANATTGQIVVNFLNTFRTSPTAIEQSGTATHYAIAATGVTVANGVPVFVNANTTSGTVNISVAATTAGAALLGIFNNSAAYLGWSAEL